MCKSAALIKIVVMARTTSKAARKERILNHKSAFLNKCERKAVTSVTLK